ncbi:MAG: class I SAM-dependent methyltransferase [Blastocatellia bacterium]
MISTDVEAIERERTRISNVYDDRLKSVPQDLYAPWQPAEMFILSERKDSAGRLLHELGKFPAAGDKFLEIGYGKLGWSADLISWGLRSSDLHGIELDENRAKFAQQALPEADLRVGDATNLPWDDGHFKFVIASTVFSSILDQNVRKIVAKEIERVLEPGGTLIWYDLAQDNPRNENVKSIKAKELRAMFPTFDSSIKRITLAPPIARFVVPKSIVLANVLNRMSLLRTHLLAALIKR